MDGTRAQSGWMWTDPTWELVESELVLVLWSKSTVKIQDPIIHSINQSSSQSMRQSSIQSINRSMAQSINQSFDCLLWSYLYGGPKGTGWLGGLPLLAIETGVDGAGGRRVPSGTRFASLLSGAPPYGSGGSRRWRFAFRSSSSGRWSVWRFAGPGWGARGAW